MFPNTVQTDQPRVFVKILMHSKCCTRIRFRQSDLNKNEVKLDQGKIKSMLGTTQL